MFKLIFLLVTSVFIFNKCASAQLLGYTCFEDGDKIAILNSCKNYLECQEGFYAIKQCEFGEDFDMIENGCVWTGSFLNTCRRECDFTNNKPVKGSNSKFIYCENGVMKQGSCEGYFDRSKKQCVPVNQLRTTKTEFNLEYLLNDNDNVASCIPGQRKSIQDSCHGYMECDSTSKWVLTHCQDCQNFEPTSLTCVWSWKYYCVGPTPTAQPHTQTEEPTTVSSIPTHEPSTPSTASTEKPSTPSTASTEKPSTPSTASTEKPSTPSTASTEKPSTPSTASTEKPSTPSTASTEKPSTSSTASTEKPSTSSTTSTEKPSTPSTASTEKPSTSSTKSTTSSSTNTTSTVTPTQVPECTKSGQKKVYEKGDCKDYLECDSGEWVQKSCSFGYHFDINNLDCTWSWWAKC